MRPITDAEYDRIQFHGRERIEAQAEISFIVKYFDGTTTLSQWEETGFYGDFSSSRVGIRTAIDMIGTIYTSEATCFVPMHLWEEGMIVKSPMAPVTALGKKYNMDLYGASYGNVSGTPSAQWVKIRKVAGSAPHEQANWLYKIMIEPIVRVDGILLILQADPNITYGERANLSGPNKYLQLMLNVRAF